MKNNFSLRHWGKHFRLQEASSEVREWSANKFEEQKYAKDTNTNNFCSPKKLFGGSLTKPSLDIHFLLI